MVSKNIENGQQFYRFWSENLVGIKFFTGKKNLFLPKKEKKLTLPYITD